MTRLTKLVEGMHIWKDGAARHCNTCAEEKATHALVIFASGTRAKKKLDILHTDVLRPIQEESYEGFRYAIGFNDSHSRYAVTYPMGKRDEVFEKLERFIANVGSPETLVSDGAQEYKSQSFDKSVSQEWFLALLPSALHSTEEWQNRDSGSAKATLAICFGYIFLCQK